MIVAGGFGGRDAHADIAAAARAFADGQAAQLEGNFERAAQDFELAYHIAPSKEALRSAVRARQATGQLPRAATLAQLLLTEYPDDVASSRLANDVLAEARLKLGRIAAACTPPCTLTIGGRATSLNAARAHVVFVAPGAQRVIATFEGDQAVTREVTLAAGDDITLSFVRPPPPDRPVVMRPAILPATSRTDDRGGLPPAFAVTGGIVTLALAGLTTWSGLDTQRAHDAYVAMPTSDRFSDGRSRQRRTNWLLGGAAATGVATALVAVFWTRWHEEPAPRAELSIAPVDGGLSVALGHAF
ncbi:MAG TPA: hypothetical protein VLM79_38590 [Kofleriaceae bacterium]|nr:hypothetical protein [Kofleriaceae bacterium]